MLKYWTKLVNAGTTYAADFDQIKKIRILNTIAIFGALAQIYYIGSIFFVSESYFLVLNNFFLMVVTVLIYYLNRFGKYKYAVALFFIYVPMSLFAINLVFGELGAEYIQFFIICISFFFFGTKTAFLVSAYAFACMLGGKFVARSFDYSSMQWAVDLFYFPNLFTTTFFISLSIKLFKDENDAYQNLIEEQNFSLLEKNEEINSQKEELFSQSEVLQEQNVRLEKAFTQITDSVKYAKRIQVSLMPPEESIAEILPDSFILFKPKDIVSGDFYWFHQDDNYLFLAAVDCTGHGVPGAFMTVIGNNLLNQIIKDTNISSPSEILSQLDSRLMHTMQKQYGQNANVNDGMDLALLRINLKTNEVVFSAAKRPLLYFKNTGSDFEMIEIKGSKFPIGSSQFEEKRFEEHVFEAKKGDKFYVFTDGYVDQFGGRNNRKFMVKVFREYLKEIHEKPFDKQKEVLNKKFEKWRGGFPQTDDVLVIGFGL